MPPPNVRPTDDTDIPESRCSLPPGALSRALVIGILAAVRQANLAHKKRHANRHALVRFFRCSDRPLSHVSQSSITNNLPPFGGVAIGTPKGNAG